MPLRREHPEQWSILELLVGQLNIGQDDELKLHLKTILKSLPDKTTRHRMIKVSL
jgi:hypothetical protein